MSFSSAVRALDRGNSVVSKLRATCWFVFLAFASLASAQTRTEIDLSGPGWKLWRDEKASWKNDPLFFPVPSLDRLPVNPPSGGWESLADAAVIPVSVPGTVEEYLQKVPGPDGDLTGVSWWVRTVELPEAAAGRRVLLRFESIRLRAEIFVNRRLAGYDVVGNSPVECDVTAQVGTGRRCEIAVRVTDPAGNFDWKDSQPMRWGEYALPLSHGFGGITGRVRLVVCDPVYIGDLYVQNTPAITDATAFVTVRNTTGQAVKRDISVRVVGRDAAREVIFTATNEHVALPPGDTVVPVKISAPPARLWDVDDPNLYVCEASVRDKTTGDMEQRVFGFRWFAMDGVGKDAVLRLNGRRIVLRSAISWGFWPVNGIFPTEELAEKQVRVAKELGLNMLNFHRAIGNPIVFEKADELGLLYFEEPGAHKSVDSAHDGFGRALAREKWMRMVRRDRSHPSLVIYNLINEWNSRNPNPDPAEIARHRDDMQAAREIDPSRLIMHTSAWARGVDIDDPAKLHFRPFDAKPHLNGWYDVHHAGGPATWVESMYRNPSDFYGRTDNVREIVFWGEEGALSTPPRLEKIEAALAKAPRFGWDGGMYREWFRTFDEFLSRKNLRTAFPSVDQLTASMGAISLGHQGKRIENMRMSNIADGYAINGWEAEILENHSGVVDCFRNPKGDPAILRYYNQPLYVAVKIRNTVVQPPAEIVADFFAVNEKNLRGAYRLRAVVRDATGREVARAELPVKLSGGDTYGELLAEGVNLTLAAGSVGALRVEAALLDDSGTERATGHDDLWSVDWRGDAISGNGAVWEQDGRIRRFLEGEKKLAVPSYATVSPRLDWIVSTRSPLGGEPLPVLPERLCAPDGQAGLRATFFSDQRFGNAVHTRVDSQLLYAVEDGAAPDPALSVMNDYAVRWEGTIVPAHAGLTTFAIRTSGAVRLKVGGKTVIDARAGLEVQTVRGTAELAEAGKPVPLVLEFLQRSGNARCELAWIEPAQEKPLAGEILERVQRDGTTLVILDHADSWMPLVAAASGGKVRYNGAFKVGRTWLGGVHFTRVHPLLAGLPVNAGMDWPYQNVVRDGNERLGLRIEGEELVAGCYHSYPMELGTALGVIQLGRGRVIFSTLDIASNLNAPEGPAHVARKLLVNFLRSAEPRTSEQPR
jgi:hypothetical protein